MTVILFTPFTANLAETTRAIAIALFNLLVEFCDLPMMRKFLLGIKERTEM